jgi:hypothetical protein
MPILECLHNLRSVSPRQGTSRAYLSYVFQKAVHLIRRYASASGRNELSISSHFLVGADLE